MRTATPISDEELARISVIVSGDLTKYVPSLISRIIVAEIRIKELNSDRADLLDRVTSLRDGLVEIAAGEPDVTPTSLASSLRSTARAVLAIDDEDAEEPDQWDNEWEVAREVGHD